MAEPSKQPARRLPQVVAILLAAAVYALLPSSLLFAPRYVIPAIEVALVLAILWAHQQGSHSTARRVSVGLAALMLGSNLVALAMLVARIDQPDTSGSSLLVGGMQVWFTSVVGFALVYWDLDRGGPVGREDWVPDSGSGADFWFPPDEKIVAVAATGSTTHVWQPGFVDYAYLSLTNSTAFSPTDTMPVSTRAKVLMGIQATAALLISLLVVARAVNSLVGGG